MQSILKKELNGSDCQYSYENTVLGRYRFADNTTTDSNEVAARNSVDDTQSRKTPNSDVDSTVYHNSLTKKSVHFGEFDECLTYYRECYAKRCLGDAVRIRKWIRNIQNAFSWTSIRLLLMDWLFLAILGIGMALASMLVDKVIEDLQTFQLFLLGKSGQTDNIYLDYLCTYLSWLGYTEVLVVCSAVFVHYVAPQAIGSGIPEMKTVLRGVVLKDFLAPKTLLSKLVGLMFSLGSGIPIGKMGPFVHIASNFANLLSNLVANVEGAYGNECRKSEMLAAACATGVASTFSAPVGGVLFSIEVTTMYFSVRNYWRGFFAAACAATVFGLLRVLVLDTEVTLVAFYPTQFPQHSFQLEELPIFAFIGLLCGFIGALFIVIYRNLVMFLRQNSTAKKIFQKNWIIYPITVAFLVATITYPRGFGRFLSGRYKFTKTVLDFFSNCTWSKALNSPESPHGCGVALLASWTNYQGYGPYNVFLVLFLFTVTFFFLAALCNTLPVPCGMFMPLFVVGAAFGRLIGEIVSVIFPDGIPNNLSNQPIFPGIYAVVGAASLTGAITHSVSVAMICCELTGQLIFIIPLMIAVIIANAVCTYLHPSIYDTIIRIKHLPYLPDLPPSNAAIHLYTAEQIMISPVQYLCRLSTYAEIRNVLVNMPKLRAFPVVEDSVSMMLLGSISRRTLLEALNRQVGAEARKAEARKRIQLAIETIDRHFREQQTLNSTERSSLYDEKESRINQENIPPDLVRHRGRHSFTSEDDASYLSLLTSIRERFKKTSANISLHGVTRKPSRSLVTGSDALQRTKSDISLNRMVEGRKQDLQRPNPGGLTIIKSFSPVMHAPSSDLNIHVLDSRSDSKSIKPESRFTVEPVKRSPQPASIHRTRRNAIFSLMSTAGSASHVDEDGLALNSRSDSGVSTPTKYSVMDSLNYNHQSSITHGINEYVKHAKRRLKYARHKDSIQKVDYDLFGNERSEWELAQLQECLEFDDKHIDPAPFQLVRRTSVYKVHSLFSLLELNRAYVTDRGRLVGVVALRDLRNAIECCQNGTPLKPVDTSNKIFDVESACPTGNVPVESVSSDTSATQQKHNEELGVIDGKPVGESLHFTFDDAQTANFINQQQNLSTQNQKTTVVPTPLTSEFIAHVESIVEQKDAEDDVLTPTIKVIHSSCSTLHKLPPVLTCIREEKEPASRRASLKLKLSTSDTHTESDVSKIPSSGVRHSPSTPLLLSMAASALLDGGNNSPMSLSHLTPPYTHGDHPISSSLSKESVVQAIEYLRRRSLILEELKTIEDTSPERNENSE